jgi:hypothetical protein
MREQEGKHFKGLSQKQNFNHILPPQISTDLLWWPQENISMIYANNQQKRVTNNP